MIKGHFRKIYLLACMSCELGLFKESYKLGRAGSSALSLEIVGTSIPSLESLALALGTYFLGLKSLSWALEGSSPNWGYFARLLLCSTRLWHFLIPKQVCYGWDGSRSIVLCVRHGPEYVYNGTL